MGFAFTYKIQDKTDKSLVYYGSSKLPLLKDRINAHIDDYNYWLKTGNNYCYSFKVLEKDNYEYAFVDKVYVNTDFELREYERKLIENNECVNHNIPNRTTKEYYQDNKEHILEKQAKYYQDNRERELKNKAEWRAKNKDKIKEYRAKNKEKTKEQRSKKFDCPCGGKYTHHNKAIHLKTNKHQEWVLCQTIA